MGAFALAVISAAATGNPARFTWLPAFVCDALPDVQQCRTAQPKQWTASERAVVGAAVERIRQHRAGAGIMAAAAANGYTGFYRFATDTQRNAAGEFVSKFGPGFVYYGPKIIGLTDAFFELADVRDARSGYRVGDLVLLHELIHAYDDRRLSTDPAFTVLAGWSRAGEAWHYDRRVDLSAYNGVYADTLTLYARGQYARAWARDRAFAASLPVPVPRIQSLVSPAEMFADVLAHLVLDPSARRELPASLVAWFDRHVLADLDDRLRPPDPSPRP